MCGNFVEVSQLAKNYRITSTPRIRANFRIAEEKAEIREGKCLTQAWEGCIKCRLLGGCPKALDFYLLSLSIAVLLIFGLEM